MRTRLNESMMKVCTVIASLPASETHGGLKIVRNRNSPRKTKKKMINVYSGGNPYPSKSTIKQPRVQPQLNGHFLTFFSCCLSRCFFHMGCYHIRECSRQRIGLLLRLNDPMVIQLLTRATRAVFPASADLCKLPNFPRAYNKKRNRTPAN